MSLNHDTTKQFDEEDKEFRKVLGELLKKRPPLYVLRKYPFYTGLCRVILIAYCVCVIDFIIFRFTMDEHLFFLFLRIFAGFMVFCSLFLCIRTTQWILYGLHNKVEEESFEESYGKWSVCTHMGIFLLMSIGIPFNLGGIFFCSRFFYCR